MFPVVEVPAGSALTPEPLGTKYKFWYTDPDFGLSLFKEGRPHTGENWAERLACELALLLGMPHALYELARYEGRTGVVSRALVARGARLVHGNELLTDLDRTYADSSQPHYRSSAHTLSRVIAYFRASANVVGAPYGYQGSASISTALDFFVGYLMFDAWIANQDRHDNNWGILRMVDGNLYLSPSYDHGSSMGRNETDENRNIIMRTRDRGRDMNAYVARARSALFPNASAGKVKPFTTIEAFRVASRYAMGAAVEWKRKLRDVTDGRISAAIDMVPDEWISPTARVFTRELLAVNRRRILDLDLTRE